MAKSVQTTLDFGSLGGKVTGLPTPSALTDAANKNYVDTQDAATLAAAQTADLNYRGLVLPQTRALIGQMSAYEPRRALTFLYDDLITTLVDAGIWAKLLGLFITAGPESQAALLDLLNPSTSRLTLVGATTFTAFQGLQADGSTGYALLSFQAGSGTLFTQNSACIGAVSRSDVASNTGIDVGTNNLQTIRMISRNASNQFSARLNDSGSASVASASSIGFFAASRTVSTGIDFYSGSGAATTPTKASATIASSVAPQGNAFSLFRSATSLGTRQLSAAFIAGGLTQTEINTLYTALKTFLSSSLVNAWL